MKLSRYKLSGATHSRGIGATFCVRCVVVPSSSADAQAARAIQSRIVPKPGAGTSSEAAVGNGSVPPWLFHAASMHTSANTT